MQLIHSVRRETWINIEPLYRALRYIYRMDFFWLGQKKILLLQQMESHAYCISLIMQEINFAVGTIWIKKGSLKVGDWSSNRLLIWVKKFLESSTMAYLVCSRQNVDRQRFEQTKCRTDKETIAKYAVDANLFRLGPTNPKKNFSALECFFFIRIVLFGLSFSRIDLDPYIPRHDRRYSHVFYALNAERFLQHLLSERLRLSA